MNELINIKLTGEILLFAGIGLGALGVFWGTEKSNRWIKEKLPNPLVALGLMFILVIGSIFFDIIYIAISLVFDPSYLQAEGFYYESYLGAFTIALFIFLAIPWLMARAKDGFFSSVGLIIALGGLVTYFA